MAKCDVNEIRSEFVANPLEAIKVVAGDGISVSEDKVGGQVVFTVSRKDYLAPSLEFTAPIYKVGTIVPSYNFAVNLTNGSEDIVSFSMVPPRVVTPSPILSWTEENIHGTDSGLWPKFDGVPTTITLIDSKGTIVTKQVGLEYRYRFFMGFSTEESLNASQIQTLGNSDLLTGILNKYATHTYTYSGGVLPVYIYWAFPSDTVGFTEALEGPMPVPLNLTLPNVNIVDEGVTKSYRVIRTAVKTKVTNAKIQLR